MGLAPLGGGKHPSEIAEIAVIAVIGSSPGWSAGVMIEESAWSEDESGSGSGTHAGNGEYGLCNKRFIVFRLYGRNAAAQATSCPSGLRVVREFVWFGTSGPARSGLTSGST